MEDEFLDSMMEDRLSGGPEFYPEDMAVYDGEDFSEEDSSDDDNFTDTEADADTLRSAGMGTDEDYGYFGGELD